MSEMKEFVIFRLNQEHYGIDIQYVENIEKIVPITRVPYTEPYVEGVVNLRGIIVPIVSLRKRFGLVEIPLSEEARIIIVNLGEYKIGLMVDSSSEVLQISTDNIDAAPNIRKDARADFIQNIGKKDGRVVMLIDLCKVLDIEEE